MKLYINEQLFSLHNRFYAMDYNEKNIYEISSEVISIGDKTTISDMKGNEVAYIEQEILQLLPTYNVYIKGELVCTISKDFSIFSNNYSLDNGYYVDGSIMNLDFDLYDDKDTLIAVISRKFLSIGDKYELDILDDSKKVIILSIFVAIANDVNRNQRNNS